LSVLYTVCFAALVLISGTSLSCGSPAVINYFNASPTSIKAGQAVTLEWEATGTNGVNINNGIGYVIPAGRAVVVPRVTTTYVLTLPNGGSKSVTIEVKPESEAVNTPTQQPATTTPDTGKAASAPVTVTLKNDNLDDSSDSYLSEQIAVWHTYAKLPESAVTASAGYAASATRSFNASRNTGIPVKSPLLILPNREGMVCIIKSYASMSYLYYKIGTTWYYDTMEDTDRLSQPGWGLATSFSPTALPFTIQKINIAAAANDTGIADDYDKYHFVVRIFDDNGKKVWDKLLPWSMFKGDPSADIPGAVWKSIDVGDVTVKGDFTVEILTESNMYQQNKSPQYHYLALAYERINSKDASTRSFISEYGNQADSWIRLYDSYANPLAFNLCIRVEGTYPAK